MVRQMDEIRVTDSEPIQATELALLQRRNAELQLLYENIRDLTSTLSVREVLNRLMRRSLAHLESEIGSILLLGPDGKLRIVTSEGLPSDVTRLC